MTKVTIKLPLSNVIFNSDGSSTLTAELAQILAGKEYVLDKSTITLEKSDAILLKMAMETKINEYLILQNLWRMMQQTKADPSDKEKKKHETVSLSP